MVNGIYFESSECHYSRLSLRADVRDMMNRMESLLLKCPAKDASGIREDRSVLQIAWAQN